MQGWKLFKHAFGMVIRNWREALRIFLVPALIGLVVVACTIGLVAFSFSSASAQVAYNGAFWFSFAATFIVSALLATWCVVAWHRFVILEEMPQGWLPTFNGGQILAYWGQI